MTATARPDVAVLVDRILAQVDDGTADTILTLLRQIRDGGGTGGGGGTTGGATEATLAAVLAQLDDATADTVISVLKAVAADTDLIAAVRDRLPAAGAASEAKLEAVRALLDTGIDVAVTNQIDVSGLARESTLEAVRAILAAEDFASEAKLEAVRALLAAGIDVTVTNPTDVSALARESTVSRKFGSGKTTRAMQVAATGDNPVVAPAAGRRLRVFWVGMSTSENNGGEVLTQVRIGGTTHYRWRMGSPGAFSHWEVLEGAPNEALIVNLDQPLPVEFNYTYEEFD